MAGRLPRDLAWSAAVDLIGTIGEVKPHGNDEYVFVVGAQKEFFKRPRTHSLDVEEIARLRKFLKKAEVRKVSAKAYRDGRVVVVTRSPS